VSYKEDGGFAFPVPAGGNAEQGNFHMQEYGVSVRDYFACAAMQGMASVAVVFSPEFIANQAYAMADAMLLERDEGYKP